MKMHGLYYALLCCVHLARGHDPCAGSESSAACREHLADVLRSVYRAGMRAGQSKCTAKSRGAVCAPGGGRPTNVSTNTPAPEPARASYSRPPSQPAGGHTTYTTHSAKTSASASAGQSNGQPARCFIVSGGTPDEIQKSRGKYPEARTQFTYTRNFAGVSVCSSDGRIMERLAQEHPNTEIEEDKVYRLGSRSVIDKLMNKLGSRYPGAAGEGGAADRAHTAG